MDEPTRQALRAVNRRFYDRFAEEFSGSRERPWPGWERLAGHLASDSTLRVLDVGCGNGRFGAFLARRHPGSMRYVGVDGCAALLGIAARRLAGHDPDLRHLDALDPGFDAALACERFDLVALLGVLHHIPGGRARRNLLPRLEALLAPGGVLAATVWRPDRGGRLARSAVPWASYNLARAREGQPLLDLAGLEAGDVLLGWRGGAETPRYCHFPADAEIEAWIAALAAPLIDRFDADGPAGRDNHYLLFRRAGAGEGPAVLLDSPR